jgi:hypothetical protein
VWISTSALSPTLNGWSCSFLKKKGATQLVKTCKDIVGPETACEVVLNGSVKPGIECLSTIKINGSALLCNDANGWALKDPSTVSIQGTACEQYKKDLSAVLEADFPCELARNVREDPLHELTSLHRWSAAIDVELGTPSAPRPDCESNACRSVMARR